MLLPVVPSMAVDENTRAGKGGDCAVPFLMAASPREPLAEAPQELRPGQWGQPCPQPVLQSTELIIWKAWGLFLALQETISDPGIG